MCANMLATGHEHRGARRGRSCGLENSRLCRALARSNGPLPVADPALTYARPHAHMAACDMPGPPDPPDPMHRSHAQIPCTSPSGANETTWWGKPTPHKHKHVVMETQPAAPVVVVVVQGGGVVVCCTRTPGHGCRPGHCLGVGALVVAHVAACVRVCGCTRDLHASNWSTRNVRVCTEPARCSCGVGKLSG